MKEKQKWYCNVYLWFCIFCLFDITSSVSAKENLQSTCGTILENGTIQVESTSISGSAVEETGVPPLHFQQDTLLLWQGKKAQNPLYVCGNIEQVEWSVEDEEYVKINQKGMVQLKKAGIGKQTIVYARVVYLQDQMPCERVVTYGAVGARPVKKISLETKADFIFVGKKRKIKMECKPKNATNRKVCWFSSNTKYASVSAKGMVKAKAAGVGKTVVITAKAEDGSGVENTVSFRIIDPKKPMIALTYDDGPSLSATGRIVDVLEKYDGRATFFMLGNKVAGTGIKKLLRRSLQNGNEFACHTYDHKNLASLSGEGVQWEVVAANCQIKKITGVDPVLMRPPYGNHSSTTRTNVGLPIILWSIDTRDWQTRNTANTLDCVLRQAKDGDIILMHDIYDTTAAATEQLVPTLVKKGYQLVTVSELICYKKHKVKAGNVYQAFR